MSYIKLEELSEQGKIHPNYDLIYLHEVKKPGFSRTKDPSETEIQAVRTGTRIASRQTIHTGELGNRLVYIWGLNK